MHDYPLVLFHDGNCPVCRFDIANLEARNHEGRLQFIDIAAPDFRPEDYGKTLAELHAEIHARRPDGSFVTGMEVFRLAYRAVGLGWVVAPANFGPLKRPADLMYRVFARHRPRISRHFGFLFEALRAWQASRRAQQCRGAQCSIRSDAQGGCHD